MKPPWLPTALLILLAGCQLAPRSAPTSMPSAPPSASKPEVTSEPSPSPSPAGGGAPDDCGFPPGAALEFSGRSTYAELRVGDAKGAASDPMSDEPADFYITRDSYNQGSLHGRLVCAIFVDENAGFIEITVHPDDWDNTPEPKPGQPTSGLSQADAEAVALASLPEPAEWTLEGYGSGAGPIGDLDPEWRERDWGREMSADHWVWIVSAYRDDRSATIIVDYVDGTVLLIIESEMDECDARSSEYAGTDVCGDL